MKIKPLFSPLVLSVAIATVASSLQCHKHKDEPPKELPAITQEGKNTFGCKVNGEVWVPYSSCAGLTTNPCQELSVDIFRISPNQMPLGIEIGAAIRYSDNSLASITISSPTNQGILTTGDKIDSVNIKYTKPGSIEYVEIIGLGSNNHFIITKLDSANKIISGTFEATLYRTLNDSVKITEGRFDLEFSVCKYLFPA